MSLIADYLGMLNMMRPPTWKKIGGYDSLADFMLKNGRHFVPQKLPSEYKRGTPRQCFMNAANLALDDHSLFYVEGFAMGVIPVNHAWCVNRAGEVIDTTWKEGTSYFGIVFKRSYLANRLLHQGTYGLLDRWEDNWPTLRHAPSRWEQPWPLPERRLRPPPALPCSLLS